MKKDTIAGGILLALGSIVLSAVLIMVVFLLLGMPFVSNLRIFILSFVAPILLLRYYAKKLQYIKTAKAIAVTLFFTMLPFIVVLVRMGEIL